VEGRTKGQKMKSKERLKDYPIHESMRGYFGRALYKEMAKNENIWLVTGDLGYKMFDPHFEDFPERVINVGASEQAGVGICVGLALQGKIPVFYSITNFTLYRPFEFIRNYIDHDKIKVILVGAGRDDDYKEDGWTHQSPDARQVIGCFPNISNFWPRNKEIAVEDLLLALDLDGPSFIGLRRR